ncbi:MAG TPA: CbtB domain-containing protein [Jatrophihabitans sp.]|jgi:cobalt transporter subunit CbtB|uniref:CbtB domain-containing protein n=1 Tax=Jatrophihabitans sp. TaxID=1932789 RepID=UPI002F0599B2
MSSNSPSPAATATPVVVPISTAALWLVSALFLGLAMYFLIGLDQGAVSVFGQNSNIHEFVHDARHLLGFPCH